MKKQKGMFTPRVLSKGFKSERAQNFCPWSKHVLRLASLHGYQSSHCDDMVMAMEEWWQDCED